MRFSIEYVYDALARRAVRFRWLVIEARPGPVRA
jgi:hypothetical protein